MQAPPPLPDPVLRRMLAIARVDGWTVVGVAALSGLYALFNGGWIEAGTSLLVVTAGTGELHGRRLLLRGRAAGVHWLAAAQAFLLAVIWAYAWWRWRSFDPHALWAQLPAFAQVELDRQILVAGLTPEYDRWPLLRMTNSLVCAVLAFVTLFYQGGLALYYSRRRHAVAGALASPSAAS